VAPLDDHLHLLVQLITGHQQQVPDHKVICFFPTARATQLAAELFVALGKPVTEIHSRKSQGHRTKAADQFRDAKSGVMMSSDVSARGLDYPDVTLVIQVGLPSSREQYIHRLGRTARAGKTGEGLLLLAPHEAFFARQLKDLPISDAPAQVDPNTAHAVSQALARVDVRTKEQAYVAWLGFYNGSCGKMGWSKEVLVQNANRYALEVLGCPGLPGIMKKTVGMMGLKGVPGLNLVSELPGGGGGGNRGGGGGGRGFGGGGRGRR
jgi:ATP-dependent RNA helicase MSS116